MNRFLSRCRAPANLRRALITALIVGPPLTAINQTAVLTRLLSGETVPAIAVLRILLTFAVPFVVSLTSAALADSGKPDPQSGHVAARACHPPPPGAGPWL